MLVLTRKPNEKIRLQTLDGPVEIVLVRVRGQRVALGIDAPASVAIARGELPRADNGDSTAKAG